MSRPDMEQEGRVGTRDRAGKETQTDWGGDGEGRVIRREGGRRKLRASRSPFPKFH